MVFARTRQQWEAAKKVAPAAAAPEKPKRKPRKKTSAK